jgi:Glycosyl hydrolases family 25
MARISTCILVTLFVSGCTGEVVREDEVADAVSSAEQALRACAGANTVEGIDVSSYQPNTRWSQVAAAGKKFAIIKATEGTGYVNASFERDWAGMAAYVSGCPLIPNEWAKFTIWQYSSSGSVAGVTTNVDLDRFNGTLAELQALASPPRPPNRAPIGSLDVADGTTVAGWAQDPDVPTQAIDAHVSFNGPAGSPTAHGVPLHANQARADLCAPLGSCAHGFSMRTPQSLCDGQAHQVHVYGIDSAGGGNPELGAKTLTCSVTPHGAKRHVIDEPSLTAWGFTFFDDVAPVSDAVLAPWCG